MDFEPKEFLYIFWNRVPPIKNKKTNETECYKTFKKDFAKNLLSGYISDLNCHL